MAMASRWLSIIEGKTSSLSVVEDWESVSEPQANAFELIDTRIRRTKPSKERIYVPCLKKGIHLGRNTTQGCLGNEVVERSFKCARNTIIYRQISLPY